MEYSEFLEYCKKDCKMNYHNIQELLNNPKCNFCDMAYIIRLNEQNNKKPE